MRTGLDLEGEKAVVMLSGGPDSAVCLAHAVENYDEVATVYVDFDQDMSEVEKFYVDALSGYYGVDNMTFELHQLSDQVRDIENQFNTEDKTWVLDSPDLTYYPLRNIQMILTGGMVADMIGAKDVYVGLHSFGNTPDSSEDTLEPLSDAMGAAGTGNEEVEIAMPFSGMEWDEPIQYGEELGVPWELTYSCYRAPEDMNAPTHCGECYSCEQRKEKFDEAGVRDNVIYER